MAVRRYARTDRTVRATIGVGLIGVALALAVNAWTAPGRTDPWRLFETIGFDLAIAVIVVGLLILGSIIPTFNQPRFRIESLNGDPRFETSRPATQAEREMVGGSEALVYEKRLKVQETKGRWAENVMVEIVTVDPPHSAHPDKEFLYWWETAPGTETATFAGGRSKWVVVSQAILGGGRIRHSSLSDADDVRATLAVLWEGKIVDAVTVRITGYRTVVANPNLPDQLWTKVEIIDRPSPRAVRKVRQKRIKALGD
jgi:hypothetical protein